MPHGDIYIPEAINTSVHPLCLPSKRSFALSRRARAFDSHATRPLTPHTFLSLNSKAALYEHVHSLLESLLADQRSWITNLSNAASLLYHCFIAYPDAYGVVASGHPVVNWSGGSFRPSPSSRLSRHGH